MDLRRTKSSENLHMPDPEMTETDDIVTTSKTEEAVTSIKREPEKKLREEIVRLFGNFFKKFQFTYFFFSLCTYIGTFLAKLTYAYVSYLCSYTRRRSRRISLTNSQANVQSLQFQGR